MTPKIYNLSQFHLIFHLPGRSESATMRRGQDQCLMECVARFDVSEYLVIFFDWKTILLPRCVSVHIYVYNLYVRMLKCTCMYHLKVSMFISPMMKGFKKNHSCRYTQYCDSGWKKSSNKRDSLWNKIWAEGITKEVRGGMRVEREKKTYLKNPRMSSRIQPRPEEYTQRKYPFPEAL